MIKLKHSDFQNLILKHSAEYCQHSGKVGLEKHRSLLLNGVLYVENLTRG